MDRSPEVERIARRRRIEKALDAGYRHSPSECLRWLLSSLLNLWGLGEEAAVPEDMQGQIKAAIEAYAEAVVTGEPFEDLLGPVYMDMASNGKKSGLGQFFSPWPIASFMAQIVAHDDPSQPEDRLLTACDPCSGSGVMMLALCNQIFRTGGASALRRWSVTCCDLDSICAQMSAVQLMANCILHQVELGEIIVLRGNSLKPWEAMDVIVHASAPGLPAPSPALEPARLASLAGAARCHPDAMEQMPLFESEELAA